MFPKVNRISDEEKFEGRFFQMYPCNTWEFSPLAWNVNKIAWGAKVNEA